MEHTDNAEGSQFATFELAGLLFGVELHRVQELIRYQTMTRVPLASNSVRGLINLRGQIVIAVDTRRALHLPERESRLLPMNVVVRSDDGCTSLLVDSIGDVVSVKRSDRTPPPENIPQLLRQKIADVYELPGRLLLIPELDRLFS